METTTRLPGPHELKRAIHIELGALATAARLSIDQNDTGLAVACEDYMCDLLNRLHHWNLKNANTRQGKTNVDGYDLRDDTNNIVIQITITTDYKNKIQETVRKTYTPKTKNAKALTAAWHLHVLFLTDIQLAGNLSRKYEDRNGIDHDVTVWSLHDLGDDIHNISDISLLRDIEHTLAVDTGLMFQRIGTDLYPDTSIADDTNLIQQCCQILDYQKEENISCIHDMLKELANLLDDMRPDLRHALARLIVKARISDEPRIYDTVTGPHLVIQKTLLDKELTKQDRHEPDKNLLRLLPNLKSMYREDSDPGDPMTELHMQFPIPDIQVDLLATILKALGSGKKPGDEHRQPFANWIETGHWTRIEPYQRERVKQAPQ